MRVNNDRYIYMYMYVCEGERFRQIMNSKLEKVSHALQDMSSMK